MSRNLTGLFHPHSITIIGASLTPQKVGAVCLKNIIASGFTGKIYPINPTITETDDLKFYPNVGSLPETPDLAIIAIPAKAVIGVLEECGTVGIKNIVIFSAGFKETGKDGQELEEQLLAVADKYQLNILGPNCLGFATTNPPLNATFGEVVKNQGNLRFITQSGAIAASLFDWCQSTSLGFNDFVTIGNKSVINENDILQHWLPQLRTDTDANIPIGLYLESIISGQELTNIIRKITPNHPVFILKPGKSTASIAAMSSHTGSIAGEDRVFEASLTDAGTIRCQELGDFFDLAQAFAWKKAPLGPQVAIISNAGGPGVLASDTISEFGLEMAKLPFPNPVDVLGDALSDRFAQALETVLQEKSAQSVLVILTPQLMTEVEKTAQIIGQLSIKYDQPVFCSFIGGHRTAEGHKILNQHHIPNYPFPERAIKTIATMWQWQNWRQNQTSFTNISIIPHQQSQIEEILKQPEIIGDQLLSAANIPIPPSNIINNITEANDFVKKYHWPVVLKLLTPKLLHKADVGGVIINIKSDLELTTAFNQAKQKIADLSSQYPEPIKIQIQQQVHSGIEVIIGIKRDPSFGPIMLFGAGGRFAEIFDDHNLGTIPLSLEKAKKLVNQSKVSKLLSGFRDDPPYKLDQLYEIMANLAQLAIDHPQIKEIEINPLIVTHQGIWAVDPKIIVDHSQN